MIGLNILAVFYLIGSIPFSFILVKMIKNVDLRKVGSGNVGATNAGRVLGKWGFIAAFTLDMLKGFLPMFFITHYFPNAYLFMAKAAVALILGHTYTCFLNFKGGKGVATAVGIYLALSPLSVLFAAIAFGITVYISKIVSLGSIISSVVLAISVLILSPSNEIKILTVVLAIFVIYKHKSNIKRIINGTENKIGQKI